MGSGEWFTTVVLEAECHMDANINNQSPPAAKIVLFRSLFRGRDDVYPRRFESRRTGKSGYQPACANEWVRDVCDKRTVRCAQCPGRRFLPVTDDAIRWHLSGRDDAGGEFVMGVYPMLMDETCFFLAVDLDKEGWREDAQAFLGTCRRLGLPAALERSRSGNGGHIWLFFEEAIPAGLARKLGSYVLTETMEERPDIGYHIGALRMPMTWACGECHRTVMPCTEGYQALFRPSAVLRYSAFDGWVAI